MTYYDGPHILFNFKIKVAHFEIQPIDMMMFKRCIYIHIHCCIIFIQCTSSSSSKNWMFFSISTTQISSKHFKSLDMSSSWCFESFEYYSLKTIHIQVKFKNESFKALQWQITMDINSNLPLNGSNFIYEFLLMFQFFWYTIHSKRFTFPVSQIVKFRTVLDKNDKWGFCSNLILVCSSCFAVSIV